MRLDLDAIGPERISLAVQRSHGRPQPTLRLGLGPLEIGFAHMGFVFQLIAIVEHDGNLHLGLIVHRILLLRRKRNNVTLPGFTERIPDRWNAISAFGTDTDVPEYLGNSFRTLVQGRHHLNRAESVTRTPVRRSGRRRCCIRKRIRHQKRAFKPTMNARPVPSSSISVFMPSIFTLRLSSPVMFSTHPKTRMRS